MPDLSPVVDTHTVTCPFPECAWREHTDIRAEYSPSMVQMFTDLAAQHREHHLGQHSGLDWAAAYEAARLPRHGEEVEEYGALMSGGGVHVWPDDPELLDIYPLAKRIEHGKRHGGHVLRRRIIVLDDWEEL